MLWAALLPDVPTPVSPSRPETGLGGAAPHAGAMHAHALHAHALHADRLHGLALWALQFTPRVAVADGGALLMELEASARLFGGRRRLAARVRQEARDLGVARVSWAPTGLGALALARAGVGNGCAAPLASLLDALPLEVISAVAVHAPTLQRLGCRTLGQVRALPRGGLSRRFGAGLLTALDRAYGLAPHDHAWVSLPETFCVRLELMSRVEAAPALLLGARRLVRQLCGWLAARRAGVSVLTLRWRHDAMRSRAAGEGGELTLRTAAATRDVDHLCRLLAEHLARIELQAAVGELELQAVDVQPFEERSDSFLPEAQRQGEALGQVLERIAARLGPQRVLRAAVLEDHRPQWMTHWWPATQEAVRVSARARPREAPFALPQPTFILPEPLRLALRGERPLYQGVVHLLCGPQRVEGGWWHRLPGAGEAVGSGDAPTPGGLVPQTVVRDYWVGWSERAGVLWLFSTRLAGESTAWFLHGVFA